MNVISKKVLAIMVLLGMLVNSIVLNKNITVEAAAPNAPTDLRCEFLTNSICIDTPTPRLSWIPNDQDQNEMQTGYQIIVSSSQANIDNNIGDMYDSGKILSNQTYGIKYSGAALSTMTRYWWKVRTWDKDNNMSAWSDANYFETAMFGISDWPSQAKWLGNVGAIHRKKFTTDSGKTIASARLYIAGQNGNYGPDGWYTYLNEIQIAPKEIQSPGQSGPYGIYSVYDVTSQLINGNNILSILTYPQISVYLSIKYTDNSVKNIGSDSTWKVQSISGWCKTGQFKEDRNASLEPVGWQAYDFNDSTWGNSGTMNGPSMLKAQSCPWMIQKSFNAISVAEPKPGVYVADLGQNMAGYPEITVNNIPAGTVITYHPNECLNDDGTVKASACDETSTYTTRGDAVEVIRPLFAIQGFRYVQISGCPQPITAEMVKGVSTCSDVLNDNTFSSSSSLINQIQSNSYWGFRNNLLSIPVDCPHRERGGWTGDAWVSSPGVMREFKTYKWYEHYLDLFITSQQPNGAVGSVGELPQSGQVGDDLVDVVWNAAAIILPWNHYQEYGDISVLQKYYNMEKRWIDYLDTQDVDYLLPNNHMWSDWQGTYYGTATSQFCKDAVFYKQVSLFSQTAQVLGNTADAATYAGLAQNIKNAVNAKYLHQDSAGKYYYDNGFQGGQAIAIAYGLAPSDAIRDSVIDYFGDRLAMDKYNVGTGMVSTEALLPALSETGNDNIAYRMATDTDSGWAYWAANGATTSWESWLGGASLDHGYLAGSLDKWMHDELGGLKRAAPGFNQIVIKPYMPLDFTHAKSEIDTMHGKAKVEWNRNADKTVDVNAVVPINVTATVYISAASRNDVIQEPAGAAYLSEGNGYVVYLVGSGSYTFKSRPAPTIISFGGRTKVTAPNPSEGQIINIQTANYTYLPTGTHQLSEVSFNAAGVGGYVRPILVKQTSTDPLSYETIWVGDPVKVTTDGVNTVSLSGQSFTLEQGARVFGGFYQDSSAKVRWARSNGGTAMDINPIVPSAPGQTITNIEYQKYDHFYAFEIKVLANGGDDQPPIVTPTPSPTPKPSASAGPIPSPVPSPSFDPGAGLEGYIECADEGQSFTLPGICDVAYGANGSYRYLYNQSGTITFNNSTFGGDPISGVFKHGYYKPTGASPAPSPSSDPGASPSPSPIQSNPPAGSKLAGTFICNSDGKSIYNGNTMDKLFDGRIDTYCDDWTSGGWAGFDLGTAKQITSIKYYPRSEWTSRMIGGKFQASNTADFSSNVVDLYTVTADPPLAWTQVPITNTNKYRYIRYLKDGLNASEIEFYGSDSVPTSEIVVSQSTVTNIVLANSTAINGKVFVCAYDDEGILIAIKLLDVETSNFIDGAANLTVGLSLPTSTVKVKGIVVGNLDSFSPLMTVIEKTI